MFQRPDQRVAIFIDTQNMYHSAKHIFGARVNFPAVVAAAVGDRRVIRAIAYVAKSKTGEEQAFFEALTQNGIELKMKDVQEFASGQKKADWDVGMTVDAVEIASKVDVVILVTGDGDFVPLAQHLQSHGLLCEVVAFESSTNARLKEVASSFMDLASDPDLFLIRPRRRGPGKADDRDDSPLDLPSDEEASLLGGPVVPPASTDTPEKPRGGQRQIRVTY
ncbi:NYN domain-containing protein [Patescibacteria group bacterium]|nr:NYN domain-containing protein [Patescibacteria group bacterium]